MARRRWLIAGQTLFGVVLFAVWLYVVDLVAVSETLRQANWAYVVLAAGVALSSSYVRAIRWRLVLRPIAKVPRLDVWLIGLVSSLINFVIPIRSGEIARSLFLKQRDKVPISVSFPTVAVDRSFDMLVMLLIGAVGVISGLRLSGSISLVLILGAALFLGFATFVILAIFWQERLMRLAALAIPPFVGNTLRGRMLGILNGVLSGFTAIGQQPRNIAPMIVLSLGAALLDGVVFYLLFLSVGNPVSPLLTLTGYVLFALTFLIPGAPGYIGSMEAFGSLVFAGVLGVPQAAAASAVLIFHALSAVLLALGGGLAIWVLGFRPSSAFRSVVAAGSQQSPSGREPQPSHEG